MSGYRNHILVNSSQAPIWDKESPIGSGSYKFDNNSIYSSVHLTTKNSNNQWSTNTGAWLGFTHDFEGCSISAEVQQNIPLKGLSSSQNKREINTSDTMVNVIVSIPF